MDNQLQPIDLIAQELSQKTIELANYRVAYNKLINELEAKEKELKELKETSPKRTGKYSKGWRKKRVRNGVWVVYSFKYGSLTHLLEFGHIKRNGGRTKAYPHLRPAELNAIQKFTERIKNISK